jgi:L-aspartate oxidase
MKQTENQSIGFTDILIVGAGIAGLSAAIKLAGRFPDRNITLISKDKPGESNTRYAQGGLAAVMSAMEDSFEQHIADTLSAGDSRCKREIVELVVREAPDRLREIIALGAPFDCDASGNLSLGLEGGHSAHRIVHAKDGTGSAIMQTLLNKLISLSHVTVLWNTLVVDLQVDANACTGITFLSGVDTELQCLQAKFVVLATGGIGQVYPFTTNPLIATGDGIAMAHRAGATIANMAFVQFHPTALSHTNSSIVFLISEALRGFGAHLVTVDGNRFMFAYDPRAELAPRDIVARAIDTELKYQKVFLDCRYLPAESVKKKFPGIYETCLAQGLDITREKIPVMPAAHYACGGIVTNEYAETNIQNLYAIGECSCTGLHGANRLASNSLIEALVFAHRCVDHISKHIDKAWGLAKVKIHPKGVHEVDESQLRTIQQELKMVMAQSAGIVRQKAEMNQGLAEIENLVQVVEGWVYTSKPNWLLYETQNLLTIGWLILQHARQQTQNSGAHFNLDLQNNKHKKFISIL